VKRTLWKNIQPEKTTAQEYAALAKQLCTNIKIDFISKNVIDTVFVNDIPPHFLLDNQGVFFWKHQ